MPALAVAWAAATLGYALVAALDRAGLVEAKGLAGQSLRRSVREQLTPARSLPGLRRQFAQLSAHAIRIAVLAAARAVSPGLSVFAVVPAAEGLVALWLWALPGGAPRRQRARFAAALGRDLLVATDLAHVVFVCFLLLSYAHGGAPAFVAASVSTLLLHFILKRQNDLRIESERQRARLAAMGEELAVRTRLAAIGRTASTVFHQIARHHGSVGMFAHLLTHGPGPDAPPAALARWAQTVREHAARILGSIEEANRVMDELLRFGQDRALNLWEQPLAELVEECIRDCGPRAARLGVPIRLANDTDATLLVDKHKIKQALVNLIDNALDASPPGTAVEVTPRADGVVATVAVRDYGAGIADAVRDTLFTPFCTTKPHGIGLGLALAKELVEAHGGTLAWRPAAPGTEFCLTLPREPRRAR